MIVKTSESGGLAGYDAGKESQRPQASYRLRHARADALRSYSWGRCAGSRRSSGSAEGDPPSLSLVAHIFADGGYAGDKLRAAPHDQGVWTIEIIKRSDTAKGFELLPRWWVVERTFAWLGRCRRLAKDWEKTAQSSTVWAFIASIRLISRRLARYCYPT